MARFRSRSFLHLGLAPLIAVLAIFAFAPAATYAPPAEAAGFLDSLREKAGSTVSRAREKARSKYDRARERAKERTRRIYERSRERARSAYDRERERVQQRARETYERSRERARDYYGSAKTRARESAERLRVKARETYTREKERLGDGTRMLREAARKASDRHATRRSEPLARLKDGWGRVKERVANRSSSLGRSITTFVEGVREKARRRATGVVDRSRGLKERLRSLGPKSRELVDDVRDKFGPSTASVVAGYLATKRKAGAAVVDRARDLITRAHNRFPDPEKRRRAVAGILVATATGAAIYSHRDAIKYVLIRETMRKVEVPVNGELRSIESVYRDAVLARAPFLEGTTIAQDPAAVIAYGVVSTTRDDLVNSLAILPDGSGRLTSVNGAIRAVQGGEQGLAALQFGATVEDLAVTTTASGELGRNAELFAVTYRQAGETIEAAGR